MKRCALCGNKAEVFSKSVQDGVICNNCRRYIPSSIVLTSATTGFLKEMRELGIKHEKEFEVTTFYGKLYLDNIHGLICYSKHGKKGRPTDFGDVYEIADLKSFGLFMSNPKDIGKSTPNVVCDVKVSFKTDLIAAQYIIAQNKRCRIIVNDEKERLCEEPAELVVIRHLVYQMLDDKIYGLIAKTAEIQRLVELAKQPLPIDQKELEWAKGAMLLDDKRFTTDNIKAQYRKLCRMFHPDIHPELPDDDMAMLNKAYETLREIGKI